MGQQNKKLLWAGWILSVLPALMMIMSAGMKLSHHPKIVESFTRDFGYPEAVLAAIGVVELSCVVIYLIPRTAVLGAILLTGYLGGAVATHVRAGQGPGQFLMPALLGVLFWGGIYLRDARLRALLPLRRDDAGPATA